jgi:hypothetical protein
MLLLYSYLMIRFGFYALRILQYVVHHVFAQHSITTT